MKTPAVQIEKVIFRKYRGKNPDVVALFPEIPADRIGHLIMSYEHVGQHGAASPSVMPSITRPATPEEYAPLKRELEAIGYRLAVYQKISPAMRRRCNLIALEFIASAK